MLISTFVFWTGISILLIPFSFDFVDALCIATVLGFVCEFGDKLGCMWSARRGSGIKVVVTAAAAGKEESHLAPDPDSEAGVGTTTTGDTSTGVVDQVIGTLDALLRPKFIPSCRSHTDILQIASAPTSPRWEHVSPAKGKTPPRNVVLSPIEKKSSTPRRDISSKPVPPSSPGSPRDVLADPVVVHWGLALVAAVQLVLSVFKDQTTSDE